VTLADKEEPAIQVKAPYMPTVARDGTSAANLHASESLEVPYAVPLQKQSRSPNLTLRLIKRQILLPKPIIRLKKRTI